MGILEQVHRLREQIQQACLRSGRSLEEVRLIGVTKYVGVEDTRTLITAGVRELGENKWTQAKPKLLEIGTTDVEWHFIGNLQTNKVKDVVRSFHWIHSLNRVALAEELQRRFEIEKHNIRCLLQVNISGEATKSGFSKEEAIEFLATAHERYPLVDIVGLMTMAPDTDQPESVRPIFRELRLLRDDLSKQFPRWSLPELSMGMSKDFEIAIEEGSTMVRVGSLLFQ